MHIQKKTKIEEVIQEALKQTYYYFGVERAIKHKTNLKSGTTRYVQFYIPKQMLNMMNFTEDELDKLNAFYVFFDPEKKYILLKPKEKGE